MENKIMSLNFKNICWIFTLGSLVSISIAFATSAPMPVTAAPLPSVAVEALTPPTPDGHGVLTNKLMYILPSVKSVIVGSTVTYSPVANPGYTVSHTVDGTCPSGSWSGSSYTTGKITAHCQIKFHGN